MKKIIILTACLCASLVSHAELRWMGDADDSGTLTAADVDALTAYVLGTTPLPKDITLLDLNGDHSVTIADVVLLVDILNDPAKATKVWIPETIVIGGEKGPFD